MKHYVIDEFRPGDFEKLTNFFNEKVGTSEINCIYWIQIPEEILTFEQKTHKNCLPLFFVIELDLNKISCEFLIRTKNSIKCDCMCYANKEQYNWLINYIDAILDSLQIIT